MSKIIIGTAGRHNVSIDIPELLVSRLLIQANSGGGKSWALRRIAEQLFGKVQTIIIDPEGEFFTLRDKFGYVLVGEGGETPADVRSAALLAQKFMELKISAVCDLFEAFRSRPTERRRWVRDFLFALLEVPRSLWGPLVVIIDEAHKFCPQETPKAGSQTEREVIAGCKDAMIALNTTGRKRGFCPVWATQRLAKVDKDASAEMFNRMVGMTIEDVDVDRAADLMSVSKADRAAFRVELRTLNPGQFFAFGRAIAKERILLMTGPIQTRHPESGAAAKHTAPPPMPDAVAKLLPKLADLPKEAEDKARTEAEYKRQIRELKNQLQTTQRVRVDPHEVLELRQRLKTAVENPAGAQQARTIQQLRAGMEQIMRVMAKVTAFGFEATKVNPKQLEAAVQAAMEHIAHSIASASEIRRKEFEQLKRELAELAKRMEKIIDKKVEISVDVVRAQPPFVLGPASTPPPRPERVPHRSGVSKGGDFDVPKVDGEFRLGNLHRQIAGILAAYHPKAVAPDLLAAMCGRTPGGSFSGRLSEVRSAGLLADAGRGQVIASEKCVQEYLGTFTPPSTTAEVLALWNPKLGDIHKQVLDRLIQANGDEVSIDELAAAVGRTPGGSFSARLSEIRSKNLLVDVRRGYVAANKEALFLEAA
jgi:hypothetical protein